MKNFLIAAFLMTPAFLAAQTATCNTNTIPVCQVPAGAGEVITKPVAIPTSTTTVVFSDARISQIVIASSAAVTVTVSDRQGTPVAILPAVPIAAGTVYVIPFAKPYWAPGGVTVVASGSGATIQFVLTN